jgi:phage terminase Nu1 subunit (DNA packaging protein)
VPKFMKAKEYAARVGYSVRTIENFIGEGLPTVGKGRLRRVDVEPADEWIRNRAAREDDEQDAVAQEARVDARRQRTDSSRRSA